MWMLFVMTVMAIIPVLTQSQSSLLDTSRAAGVGMVERMTLTPRARKGEFYNGRYATGGNSFNLRFNQDWMKSHETLFPYVSEGEFAVQHSRLLTTTSSDHQVMSTDSLTAEVEALIAFKEGVTKDSLGALSSWNSKDSNTCQWKGVTCALASKGVVALDLGNLQLAGSITPLLGSLQYLQHLNLSDNFFTGAIPTSLLNCSNLSYLGLGNNNLTGQIPSQIGDLRQLQSLDLSNNTFLAGTFPSSLGNCSLLRFVFLNSTNVGGEIPSSVGKLAHLEILDLSLTALSGTIPQSLGNCSSLTHLAMGNYDNLNLRNLRGELPTEMGSLTGLSFLSISGSYIDGPFPVWIANFTRMTYLSLSSSSLSGEIPDFLGQLPLARLDLAENNFTGSIPKTFANCSQMSSLVFETNSLTGFIPPELGLLTELNILSVTRNDLSGKIPSSLANCSALANLLLGENPLMEAQAFPAWIGSLVNIVIVYLPGMNLQGEIPADIGKLSQVQDLIVRENSLMGQIPATIGNCTSLLMLDVFNCQLSGDLPSDLGVLSQLQSLILLNNFFTGALPASIGNFSGLQYFRCDGNNFTGVIPQEIGSLQYLQILTMVDNNFHGCIPTSVGNSSAMRILQLSGNQLIGTIPLSLGNLTGLQELYLDNNLLEGSIPGDLTRCLELGDLYLSGNSLNGSIPESIGRLWSLQWLYLDNNNLAGALPESLGNCSILLYVDLSHNAFSGTLPSGVFSTASSGLNSWNVSHNLLSDLLPPEVAQLLNVNYLDFSANNFSGSIPSGLGKCKALLSLDLSSNSLSGSIPQTLAQLPHLTFFNVSDNRLEGPIPTGGVFATKNLTAASFFGNAGLCGDLLGNACPNLAPSRSPAAPPACRGFQCSSIRIAEACSAAGLVFAILLLICWLQFDKGKTDIVNRKGDVMTFERGLKLSKQDLVTIMERPENKIGVGAGSIVYKGTLRGDQTVAIKVLSIRLNDADYDHKQAVADLLREAQILSKLRHRNILKVVGFCSAEDVVALISEFMPKGSLNDQLYPSGDDGPTTCELNWDARLNIALGVAHGLVYLHSQLHEPVIHRDLKPSNIFLDADLEPKLGDFGVSRFVDPTRDGEKTASDFCGTFGYIPPEYGATMRVSTKGDVYSYGVILLELLTRKHPILAEEPASGECSHIMDWVLESFEEKPLEILDNILIEESIVKENHREQMKLLMRVGLLCTRREPQNRPQMNDVVAMVNQIKERGSDRVGHPSLAELAHMIAVWDTSTSEDRSVNSTSS